MKVLHLPTTFFPTYTGGKEVLVYQWIMNNAAAEHRVAVHGKEAGISEYHGIPVHILPPTQTQDARFSYYSQLFDQVPGFEELLEDFKPDIVHFHDFGSGASLTHLRICKSRDIKTIVTYHSPGSSCMQHGLLYGYEKPCDGRIDIQRCTTCRYKLRKLPGAIASLAAMVSAGFDKSGKFILRNSTEIFSKSWYEFYESVDAVMVYGQWVKDVIVLNRIPAEKVHLVKMGGHPSLPKTEWNTAAVNGPLKIVFSGRCTPIKGAHLLLEAIRSLPKDYQIEVHFFGPYWDDSEYGKKLKSLIADDSRLRPPRMIHPDHIQEELKKMDVSVIPSLWPETGPLTLFDAFSAGLPVIGTNLAGIAERVRTGTDGLLFEWNDSRDLARQIEKLVLDRSLVTACKNAILENHTFKMMAQDIQTLYKEILDDRK